MTEYIERDAAIRALLNDSPEQVGYSREDAADCIRYMDAADVASVRHGRWEYYGPTINTYGMVKCTVCNWWTIDPSVSTVYHYCPNCGAKMDDERKDGGNADENRDPEN